MLSLLKLRPDSVTSPVLSCVSRRVFKSAPSNSISPLQSCDTISTNNLASFLQSWHKDSLETLGKLKVRGQNVRITSPFWTRFCRKKWNKLLWLYSALSGRNMCAKNSEFKASWQRHPQLKDLRPPHALILFMFSFSRLPFATCDRALYKSLHVWSRVQTRMPSVASLVRGGIQPRRCNSSSVIIRLPFLSPKIFWWPLRCLLSGQRGHVSA